MIHRTPEDWKTRPLILLIDHDHLPIVRDTTWLGMNVYEVNIMELLIEWWNNTIRYAGHTQTREIKDKKIQLFHSAVWIRINMLHDNPMLRFVDITIPELMKKV
jgi:hypothetical protein